MASNSNDSWTLAAEERALELQASRLRGMTPADKLNLVRSHSRMVVGLADVDVRHQHPDWTDRQIRIEASRRWLTPQQHAAAFGEELRSWTR